MSIIADKLYTREEFLSLPDSVGYEWIDGHLVERNVSTESSRVAMGIGILLGIEARKTGEAIIYGSDLTYDCFHAEGRRMRRADASLIRQSRLEGLEDAGAMSIPADLVVEVLSPNDEAYDVNIKVEAYVAAGFRLVWVVDPNAKIVFIHRADRSMSKLFESDEITGETALPSFRCKVAEFFAS
jgi:Uma2 family endonuclease